MPSELTPAHVTAIVDSREQTPLDLSPLRMVTAKLNTGDYSVRGLEYLVSIERKSLNDLLICIGKERTRFENQLGRLRNFETRAVVVECTWSDLERGQWPSRVTVESAVGSVLAWNSRGIPFLFCGDHAATGRAVAKILHVAARKRWRELRGLAIEAVSK